MTTTKTAATATVTIISIWSKIDGLEGKLSGRNQNVVYDVEVPRDELVLRTLDNAYRATNRDDRPMATKACSTSCGDVMVLDGTAYLVEGGGYAKLTTEQAEAIKQMDSRTSGAGLAWLVKQGLV